MKKKIKYYFIAAVLSIICDSMAVYTCYQGIIEHPDSLVLNICLCCLIGSMTIVLNLAFFLQAGEELKPKNECFVMRLPGVVQNDDFEFPKLKY